ncbi:MAG: hypothetical protein ACK4UP_11180 [Spirosomataceae bacterium]
MKISSKNKNVSAVLEDLTLFCSQQGIERFEVEPITGSPQTSFLYIQMEISVQIALLDHENPPLHNEFMDWYQKQAPLFVLWTDYWQAKKEIVFSKILHELGRSVRVPARVCQVRRITAPESTQFLQNHHLHPVPKARIHYGLFLPSAYFRLIPVELFAQLPMHSFTEYGLFLAVSTFSNAKKIERNNHIFRSYEWIRSCSHKGFVVVGGLHKLLKTFEKDIQPDDLVTYADVEWSPQEGAFQKIGFEPYGQMAPCFYRWNDQEIKREKIQDKLPTTDFVPLFNLGSTKWIRYYKTIKEEHEAL